MNIMLVRHGESIKNIEDRHGGAGAPLTSIGIEQILRVCGQIASDHGHPSVIFCSSRVHILESARLMADFLNVPLVQDSRIEPMYLGVIDGLSRAEAARTYPDAAEALESWRATGKGLEKLAIPEVERFEALMNRALDFLSERIRHTADESPFTCIVGSNSILIMLINLLTRDWRLFPESYTNVITPNAFWAMYDFDRLQI